ncbi:hypothetical protein GCM10023185_12550 [Hymenobacter saemangeumensis]|uniref:RCC1-like domain-containing protein n=1 Tax=Hymenobacter saemangeumensis TaxID=1084522 RepID=A0ABP8I6X5_9BACT
MKNLSIPTWGQALLFLFVAGTAQAQSTANTFAASSNHSVSIHPDGSLRAWGLNLDGQLGDGTTTSRTQPTPVGTPANLRWAQVAAGTAHTLALTADGQLYAWGSNAKGQLGDGTFAHHHTPIKVALPAEAAATQWAQVAAGTSHTLALTTDGRLYAWGQNIYGQLGDGTTLTRANMVQVTLPAGAGAISQIVAGSGHSLALTKDGQLYAWGANKLGQLGDGSFTERLRPVAVTRPRHAGAWAQIAAGRAHTLALTTDGQLYGWGSNEYAQVAATFLAWRGRPTAIALPADAKQTRWAQIAAGDFYSQALTADGRLYAWGNNTAGQLGDGSTITRLTPVAVALPQDLPTRSWARVAAGGFHTLALTADGQLCTWGNNTAGQLGDGSTTQRTLPAGNSRALLQPTSRESHSSQLPSAQIDPVLTEMALICEAALEPLHFDPAKAWANSAKQ